MKMHLHHLSLKPFVTAALVVAAAAAAASEPTAFQLIKEGNRHVGEESRDRIVQIRSEKSVGSLVPNIWYIVYYDADATAKAVEVKFAAGQKTAVKRTARILEPITGSHRELPKDKLRIDSDKAIELAKSDPMLRNLKPTNTRLTLERWDDMPVWKVRLWVEKVRKPSSTVDIGELFLSADTGKVVKNDLKPQRAD
jgi:hypothetical protein